MNNNNAANPGANNSDDDEDAPWTPGDDFQELFIRMEPNNTCVISGPSDQVKEMKEKIASIVIKAQEMDKIKSKLQSINTFEFHDT